MPHVAIQAERTRMMEKKEMILYLVEVTGAETNWVPADTIYEMAHEAPELTQLLRSQVKAYLYTLREEGKLVMKFEHGKFAVQTAGRAKALDLMKPVEADDFVEKLSGKPKNRPPVTRESDTTSVNHPVKAPEPPEPPSPEPQPDPLPQAGVAKEAPMRELKATWQVVLNLIREIAEDGQISTNAFVAEGIKRNLGSEGSLRQYIPRLLEKGHLSRIHKGLYKVVPDQNAAEETGSTPTPPQPAAEPPVVDPPPEVATQGEPPPEAEAPRKEEKSPFEAAASLLHSTNGERRDVTRALTRATRLAAVLQGIPEEQWDQALDLAKELARAGK